ncbi:MAG TPA: MmgE/PrpD family protein [Candidatus Limnocylindria bacterium]|nr:MmgE/PrpD family protein [Candidatus Limnocylindria bacterium]
MPDVATGVSAILAAFVVRQQAEVPPRAHALLAAARAARERSAPIAAELAEALASSGVPLIAARARGAAFAADPALADVAAVLASALVGGELAGAAEARTVAAIAVGCEIGVRLRRAVRLDPAWDPETVVAVFGAVAAAAHVLTLDEAQAREALGVAATQATGLRLARGTTAGAAAVGKAASDALEAAVLARHGFTGGAASIEGRRGFAALMASGCNAAALLDGLGEEWRFADP